VLREATGIVGDIKGIASTGLRAVRTRLELLAIELKEEKAWAERCLIVAVSALYLLTFGLLLAGFAALFLATGAGAIAYIVNTTKHRTPLFGDTIAVLKGDEKALHETLRSSTGD